MIFPMKSPFIPLLAGAALFVTAPALAQVGARIATTAVPVAASAPAPKSGGITVGAVAPDFVSIALDGREVRLSAFKERTVILDYWATWCGPCMEAMSHTQEIARKYKEQGVVVLAVCTSDKRDKFEAWVKKNQAKYPDVIFTCESFELGSPRFLERSSYALFDVEGLPTQIVINRDGVVTGSLVGMEHDDARTEALLARAGLTVEPAVVEGGGLQLEASEAETVRRAEMKVAADGKIRPSFFENIGHWSSGMSMPEVTIETITRKPAPLRDYTAGKTTVLALWGDQYPDANVLGYLDDLAGRYRCRGLKVVGIGVFTNPGRFTNWAAQLAGKYSFPILVDPSGPLPSLEKDWDELNEAEKKDFQKRTGKLLRQSLMGKLTGDNGLVPPPLFIVVDAAGNLVGAARAGSAEQKEAMGNLLMRAGMTLEAQDHPERIFTREETKPEPDMIGPGEIAPDFTAVDAKGQAVKLSDLRGKVVVVDLWATWCGPCIESMPHTQEIATRYKDQGVVVLGVCVWDARKTFEPWLRANQQKFPDIRFVHDPLERKPEGVFRSIYHVKYIPAQFVIDRAGHIVDIIGGSDSGALLDAGLAKAGVKVDPALLKQAKIDAEDR